MSISRTTGIRWAATITTVLAIGGALADVSAAATADTVTRASAALVNTTGAAVGTATFETIGSRTTVSVVASGLSPGFHGMHVHAIGSCVGAGGFVSAGGHHNPDSLGHGDHDADLPPLFATASGEARLVASTDRMVIADLLSGDGSALVVHALADNLANIPARYEQVAAPGTFGPDAATLATGDSGARFACGVLTDALAASADDGEAVLAAADPVGGMRAVLVDASGATRGQVSLDESEGRVEIRITMSGLTPGFHGMHAHAVGLCDGTGGFTSAGPHHNPAAVGHGAHDADLVALLAASDGTASGRFLTDRFTAAELLDADGSAIVVHAGRDNYGNIPTRYDSTDPTGIAPGPDGPTLATGDAGARFACGVLVPSTNTERYVERVYGALLGRAADAPGRSFWTGRLDGGLSRGAFTTSIGRSGEADRFYCELAYQQVLGRTGDAAGVDHFAAQLAAGMTVQSLEAVLAGSSEFRARAGGTDGAVVDALYRTLLGRPADGAGLAFWTGRLAAGQSAASVATALLGSPEGRERQVRAAYLRVLERSADPAGLAFWSSALAAGADRRTVLAELAASAELVALP